VHKATVKKWMREGRPIWEERPLRPEALQYAVDDVRILARFAGVVVGHT
jgi:ribonuclease D